MSAAERLDEIQARADKAATLVGALSAGTAEWRMQVPVHDDDSDIVLMGTAEDCEKVVAALRAALDQCDRHESIGSFSDYEIGRKYVAGCVRRAVENVLGVES